MSNTVKSIKEWSQGINKITDESIFAEATIPSKEHGSCIVFICGSTPEEALAKRAELYSIVGEHKEQVVENDKK